MANIPEVTHPKVYQPVFENIASVLKNADRFIAEIIQLGLILFLINRLQLIELPAYYNGFAWLIFGGFIVNHLIPKVWRLPFFFMLSIAGILLITGFGQGIWLIVIGLLFIIICHLPIPFNARLALIILAGVGIGLARASILPFPVPSGIWPIVGSMFMFRLLVYVHHIQHQKQPASIWTTLSYFFLLPNVLYPLFPIVDFSTFNRTYYNSDPYKIYQRGIQWITVGVAQLIIYRYINLYLTLAPIEVTNIAELIQYLITDYLLILRLVGHFQIVIGILLLFGFNLPKVFNNFLLSDSFSDYWRRVNIYWKDFMTKLVFNSVYFRLRKRGPTIPLVVGTIMVFIASWMLHSYQWFWLRGAFLLTWTDVSFWAILGTLALINSLRAQKKRPQPGIVGRGIRVIGTFASITLLWSLWTSPTYTDWFTLLTLTDPWNFKEGQVQTLSLILLVLLIALIVSLLAKKYETHPTVKAWLGESKSPRYQNYLTIGLTTGAIIFLIAIFERPVYRRFGPDAARTIIGLTSPALSRRDDLMLTRGYYEDLADVNRLNGDLWGGGSQEQPPDWLTLVVVRAAKLRDDTLELELHPNLNMYYKRAAFSTNSWGFRDQEYELVPPPNTCRIALLGGSIPMGAGVSDREVFDVILENRLNEEGLYGKHVELLNFSTGGYQALHRLASLQIQALKFDPDIAVYIAHPRNELAGDYLMDLIRKDVEFPPEIQAIFDEAGIENGMAESLIEKKIQSVNNEILFVIYQQFVQESISHDIVPVMIIFPRTEIVEQAEIDETIEIARAAGFTNIINIARKFDGYDLSDLWVATWDRHPNGQGHLLIANNLYDEFRTNPVLTSPCSQ